MTEFLSALDRLLADARHRAWPREAVFAFGARDLRVHVADESSLPAGGLMPGMGSEQTVDLYVIDPVALPGIAPDRLGPYDAVLDSIGTEWMLTHQASTGSLLAYNARANAALLAPGRRPAPRERAEFCRPLLHWLAIAAGNVVVHAGGLALGDRGVLVAGAGNAGKSTLVRACLADGFGFLGDNVVEVAPTDSGATMFGVYPTVKIRPGSVIDVPSTWPVPEWDAEARKDIHFLSELAGLDFRTRGTALAAVLVLDERGPVPPAPLRRSEAFFLVAPNTVAQFPFLEGAALTRTGAVAGSAPTYTAGRIPPTAIGDAVRRLIIEPGEGEHD